MKNNNIYVFGKDIPDSLNHLKNEIAYNMEEPDQLVDENGHLRDDIKQLWVKRLSKEKSLGDDVFIISEPIWYDLFNDDAIRKLHLVNISYQNKRFYINKQSGWFFRYVQAQEYEDIINEININIRKHRTNPYHILLPLHPEQHYNCKLYFTNLMTNYSDRAQECLQLPSRPLYRIEFTIVDEAEVVFSEVDKYDSDIEIYDKALAMLLSKKIKSDTYYYWQLIYSGKDSKRLKVEVEPDCLNRYTHILHRESV